MRSVYNVFNIGDFLDQDLPTVSLLLKLITENENSVNAERSRTKAIAINRLKKDLTKYEERLKRDYVIG